MGLLDSKTIIYDVVLTDKGRELFSKDELDFTYYAFSDEGINYSGSMVNTGSIDDMTLDNYLHRNLNFEADQRKGYDNQEPLDLDSFLYTVSPNSKTIPDLKLSTSGTIVLKRSFKVEDVKMLGDIPFDKIKDLIVRVEEEDNKTKKMKALKKGYATTQSQEAAFEAFGETEEERAARKEEEKKANAEKAKKSIAAFEKALIEAIKDYPADYGIAVRMYVNGSLGLKKLGLDQYSPSWDNYYKTEKLFDRLISG